MQCIALKGAALKASIESLTLIEAPLDGNIINSALQKRTPSFMGHSSRILSDSSPSVDFYALVHMPIESRHVRKIQGAREAVDGEFNHLSDRGTGRWKTLMERRDVIKYAKENDITVHFGSAMELCHLKHAELSEEYQKYKGRIFRVDIVKDEEGSYAVFSEQGAAASEVRVQS